MDIQGIIQLVNRSPVISLIILLVVTLVTYGLSGLFGGFWPTRVKLQSMTFFTASKNALNSERLTRIVQWRYYGGGKLPEEVRKEILEKYGPHNGKHYKDVKKK